VGSNPAAPTKIINKNNDLFGFDFKRHNSITEHNGTEWCLVEPKLPRKSHAMWLICSFFGFFCLAPQAPAQPMQSTREVLGWIAASLMFLAMTGCSLSKIRHAKRSQAASARPNLRCQRASRRLLLRSVAASCRGQHLVVCLW
jgi:hypothetical protein